VEVLVRSIFNMILATVLLIGCGPNDSAPRKDSPKNDLIFPSTNTTEYKCDFAGVQTIKLALYPDRVDSGTFDFRFQVFGDLKPDSTVVVFLPGGPGGSSMADYNDKVAYDKALSIGMPANTPWIFFDPRTVGCNRGDEKVYPDDALTTWYLAGDVLAVLNSLHIKKYILFGHSYGTQWATLVAGRASNGEAPTPLFTLLSGVLGRGEASGTFSIPYNMSLEWNLLRAQLSPKALAQLDVEKPLGFEAKVWGRFATRGLYSGVKMQSGGLFENAMLKLLQKLESNDPIQQKPLLDALAAAQNQPPSKIQADYSERLFEKIDCHEFSPADGFVIFSKGQIIRDPDDTTCANDAFDRPYDSAAWQIRSPIYYLSTTRTNAAM
jgi:pimeloyl-ACP methyl ester carboxylesterase